MKPYRKLIAIGSTALALVIGGCANGPVKPSDRDTTGTYDGVWVGSVDSPTAKRVSLPNNWTMRCDWEPFDFYLVVDDGRVQLGKLETKTPVSTSGRFRLDITHGSGGMIGGIMSGNGQQITIFSGNLSGDARGKYQQINTAIGTHGCSSKIRFERYTESTS